MAPRLRWAQEAYDKALRIKGLRGAVVSNVCTHARTHARTDTHTHTHTHAHKHTQTLSLSLSLSHTHTHARTHARTQPTHPPTHTQTKRHAWSHLECEILYLEHALFWLWHNRLLYRRLISVYSSRTLHLITALIMWLFSRYKQRQKKKKKVGGKTLLKRLW